MLVIPVTLFCIMAAQHGSPQLMEPICCDGSVRLAGGPLPNEGRVELCTDGQWKTVCGNNWSMNEAQVVCRQLGYTNRDAVALTRAAYGQGVGMIVEEVRCNSSERQLLDCVIRDDPDGLCNHHEDAAARCFSACRSGDIRLQGSGIQDRGRVEVCVNGVWGTVCDDYWSNEDAAVVCRQLGFSRFGAVSLSGAHYGRGSGPIHMDDVMCVGNESALSECPHITLHNCNHHEDASVRCRGSVCSDGDVRLVNGSQPSEGRVEVCFNETWGTVCAYINSNSWNSSEANVVCKQLGFSGANASTFQFGRGSRPIIAYYPTCRGFESTLADCTFSTSSTCYSGSNVVGVVCQSESWHEGEIRLTNGLTQYEGRVEIYWNLQWRAICSEGWDESDARVVCRQLNYLSTSHNVEVTLFQEHKLNSRRVPIHLTNVGCSGLERHLLECCSTNITDNYHCQSASGRRIYAGVRCGQCEENSIRLVGELSHNEGFVVICLGGSWGKVCGWSATVVCRQLGFSTEGTNYVYYDRLFWSHDDPVGLPVIIESMHCSNSESRLVDCNYTLPSRTRCYYELKLKCQISGAVVPGAPQNIIVSNVTSSSISLLWSPPQIADRYGLAVSNYVINCSANSNLRTSAISISSDSINAIVSHLHPATFYQCCIAANSSNGMGEYSCQYALTGGEKGSTVMVPSDPPSRVESTIINSSTVFILWYPSHASQNACMAGGSLHYYVEITEDNGTFVMSYETKDAHLLITSLRPGHLYTVRVAINVYNVTGPYSSPVTILAPMIGKDIQYAPSQSSHDPVPLISSMTSLLGLISLALIVVLSVTIYLYYKLSKARKKISSCRPNSVQAPVYEMVHLPRKNTNHPDRAEDSSSSPYTPDPAQAAQEYATPIVSSNQQMVSFHSQVGVTNRTKCSTLGAMRKEDNNTYQPLIPPRIVAGVGKHSAEGEYQQLSMTRHTLPRGFNVSDSAPALPPKPK